MIIFWCVVSTMILLALFIVLRPLRYKPVTRATGDQTLLNIYRERLKELERDKEYGVLDSEQYQAVKQELERSLLGEVENGEQQPGAGMNTSTRRVKIITSVVVILFLPAVSLSIYFSLGQYRAITGHDDITAQHSDGNLDSPSIEFMVEKLAQRMQNEPGNVEGWQMLGRSYMALGRYDAAVTAIQHLHELLGDQPDVLLQYADALSMASGGNMAGKPEELVHKALQQEPDNIIGLWLAGMAAFQRENYQDAIDFWQRSLAQLQDDPQSSAELEQLIAQAHEALGIAVDTEPVPESDGTTAGETDTRTIIVKVTLAPELNTSVDGEDTVFIFARALNGSPMPIAVVRKQVKDLPVEITLDDSMAVMPTRKLSSFDNVEISARISKSGNAMAQSGDWVANQVQVEVGKADIIPVVIEHQL